ncbi:MAG: HAD-IA family hydrolase [Burkholderiales bacterium]
MGIRAVLWDFGGVITTSPFEAFARFERDNNLPAGLLRRINSTNPDGNAWARFERGELSYEQFDGAFGNEALALGYRVGGAQVAQLLYGEIRPQMVEALRRLRGRFRTACVTNNFKTKLPVSEERGREIEQVMQLFDLVIESSKVGVRKPELRFYELAIEAVDVPAYEIVYLDDLGINLKPARALGMTTIKVTDPDAALAELDAVLGTSLK